MNWPDDAVGWFNFAASASSFVGLALTIWTLVLVRRLKDQRARLVLLPDNLARIRSAVEILTTTDDEIEARRALQRVDGWLAQSAKLLSGQDRKDLLRECAAVNRFAKVQNPSQLPPLPELGVPAIHALAVFEGIVERSRLQEP